MTQREEFENKIKAIDELFGITRNLKHDVDTDNYFDAPTNSAYMWFKHGWKSAKATSFNLPECMDYEFRGDKVINDPFADGYNQCLSDVIAMNEEYANSTVSDGWIPFSERHPDEDEKVIVFDTNDDYGHIYTLMFYSGFLDRKVGATVTHWMPLPAAPEQTK